MVQLLEVINEVTKELQELEELEGTDLVDLVSETVERSPEQSQWLAQIYQSQVHLVETNQLEYVEAVILGLTTGATFPITIAGATCNAPTDKGASQSCITEHFYKQIMLPLVWQVFHFSIMSASGNTL